VDSASSNEGDDKEQNHESEPSGFQMNEQNHDNEPSGFLMFS
jgi:hypothetical protein